MVRYLELLIHGHLSRYQGLPQLIHGVCRHLQHSRSLLCRQQLMIHGRRLLCLYLQVGISAAYHIVPIFAEHTDHSKGVGVNFCGYTLSRLDELKIETL